MSPEDAQAQVLSHSRGWPKHDPRKVNDWPDFGPQNVKLPPSNPRYMQAPIRHSSGVAPYGEL